MINDSTASTPSVLSLSKLDFCRSNVKCLHCGQPVPDLESHSRTDERFCCEGCRSVYTIIQSHGMGRFYDFRNEGLWKGSQPKSTLKHYTEFDDPTFLRTHCKPTENEVFETQFYLEGVHCAACVWLVEKLPNMVFGVVRSHLNLRTSILSLKWHAASVKLSEIAQKLDKLGYPPHPAKNNTTRSLRIREDRQHILRLGVAGALAGNIMLMAIAMYAGLFTGIQAEYNSLLRWASMLLGWISLLGPGKVFFNGAWSAIVSRTPHMDLPIALGLGVGGITGTFNTLFERGDIYFDSLAVLVFLLLIGRWIQYRQQRKVEDAVELLFSMTPSSCKRLENGEVREISIESLRQGDLVEVTAGQIIPGDGNVVNGQSNIDESLLTGESKPRSIGVKDSVYAGTINVSSIVRVRIKEIGMDTRVGKLMKMVEEGIRNKSPIVMVADRMAGVFTVAVLLVAASTFGIWWWMNLPLQAANHTIALLIVACPCALGLATPLALAVTIGRAAKRKILIKGGNVLEHLSRKGTVFFDKTGTITAGKMSLFHWHGAEDVKSMVAAVEAQTSHPIARAFLEKFSIAEFKAHSVIQDAEGGISGKVANQDVLIGSCSFMRKRNITLPDWASTNIQAYLKEALTPVIVAVEGHVKATAAFGDPIRTDAQNTLSELYCLGWEAEILSGDHPDIVRSVANALGVPENKAKGGLTPEEKLRIVNQRKKRELVVMIGDGVNDAAALSSADVGIAIRSRTDVSLTAADISLVDPRLSSVVELIRASRRTVRGIRRNLIASLSYNITAVSLAGLGYINPLVAAVLMPLSSFTVVSFTLAAKTFDRPLCR